MKTAGIQSHLTENAVFFVACVLVIGSLVLSAVPGIMEYEGPNPDGDYYNLLVQGFRAGQLNVRRDPPPGLAQLADPYNPRANRSYVLNEHHLAYDMSYYRGKLYLYFGVTPALVLFWPYVTITGHYLSHRDACVIFSVLGFVIMASLIYGIWRHYFPEISPWVAASGVMAVGLAGGLLAMLSSCQVYEVAVSCGFAFAMMALAAIWRALHEGKHEFQWLALASLAYGLAVASRPSLLFGSVILLVSVIEVGRRKLARVSWWHHGLYFAAAVVPLILVGMGLMLYNFLRFGSPFEFGWHYQLTDFENGTARQFSLHYAWFNFRFYFLEPMRWTAHFPFLQEISMLPIPRGHAGIEAPYAGILSNYPVVWMALAAPLAWTGPMAEGTAPLRWFSVQLFLFSAICAATVCLFVLDCSRYVVDFLPVLFLLAVIGIFCLERVFAQSSVLRAIVRCVWCLLLAYSLAFNILAAIDARATTDFFVGNLFFRDGHLDKAIGYFNKASMLKPHSANLHFALGNALSQAGRTDESIVQFQKALEIEPNFAEADNNLAYTLLRAGQVEGAIKYFQKASELQKSYQAFYNLGCAFRMNKMAREAETNWQQAIELQPQFIPAQIDLAWMLATWPDAAYRDGPRAVALADKVNQLIPNDPKVLRTLAAAFAETGRFADATETAKQAMALAKAGSQTGLMEELQSEIGLYQNHHPYRSTGE